MRDGLPHEGQDLLRSFEVLSLVSANHEGQSSGCGRVDSARDRSVDKNGSFGLCGLGHGSADGWVDRAAVDQESSGLEFFFNVSFDIR